VFQAKITADYILKNYKIDAIYSSDLIRAIDTARPIAVALGLPIKTDSRLREIYAGEWQGMLFSDVSVRYAEEYEEYKRSAGLKRTHGGESLLDVLGRTYEAVLDIIRENEGKTILVSSHNGPIKALTAPFLNIELPETQSVSNNSVTEVLCDNGKYEVIKLGYDGHLGELVTKFKEKTAN
jgi:probable phosphoglycerate mutase